MEKTLPVKEARREFEGSEEAVVTKLDRRDLGLLRLL